MPSEGIRCWYCSLYGVKATPPWKNTSRFGHTSQIFLAPEISRTLFRTDIIQDGTPLRLVTFFFMASRAICVRFISKSLSRAVFFLGVRTRFTNGLIFSMRIKISL